MKRTNSLGLLGGTFNPVHNGHIQLGLTIREHFHLDRMLYILSAHPPHKKYRDLVPAELRFNMLETALKPYPELVPCDIEMKRPHDSWTIVTIEELKRTYPEHRLFFISGSEGFLKIRTWKNYKQLLRMLSFIVVLREGTHDTEVRDLLHSEGITTYPYTGEFPDREEDHSAFLYTYRSDILHLSSTLIRNRVKESQPVEAYVPPGVLKIMEENKLYEN